MIWATLSTSRKIKQKVTALLVCSDQQNISFPEPKTVDISLNNCKGPIMIKGICKLVRYENEN